MKIRNLGDKYYTRLDKSDSHGRSNINWINVLVKTRPVHRGKDIFFIGTVTLPISYLNKASQYLPIFSFNN